MACFFGFGKRFLVLILLIQLTLQSVLVLEPSQAQAAAAPAAKESPAKGDFSYSSLMRQIGELKEKDLSSAGAKQRQLASELEKFLESEESRIKELHLPYFKRRAYLGLLEKQLDSLDTAPPGKIESIINTISSWFSSNQDEITPEPAIQEPDKPAEFAFAPDGVRLTSVAIGELPVQWPEPKSWWQRLWQKIKDLFGITSVLAQENNYLPTVADINLDNQEVIINSDINDLVVSLNYNPVKIFNYVRANIIYEPYYGAKKGSAGCLAEKVCNDVDTASLTIALLRASGIPARYHKALAVVPVSALKEMLGVDEVKTIYFALAANKIPVSLVGGNNPGIGAPLDEANLESETQLALEWVVPEIFYEYDERGGNINNTINLETISTATTTQALQSYLSSYPKKQWLPAEVLIKNPLEHIKKEIVADTAGFDSQAFWYGFLQYQGALSPMEKYQDDLLSAASKDVFTANYQSTKTRPTTPPADILPPSLPYHFTVGTDNTGASITDERWSILPDSRREQVIITLKKSSDESTVLSHAFFASEINNIPINLIYDGATQTDKDAIASYGGLAYTPASLVAITPSFNLEGASYATANTLSIGDSLILDFQYQVKGQIISQNQKFSIAGNEEGVYIAFGQIQSDLTLDDPNLTSAQRASRILIQGNAALAREYLKHYQEQNDLLKKSLDYEYQVQFSRAVVTQNRILTPVGSVPTTFDFQGLSIDAASYISDYSSRGNYKTHRQPFRLISSLEASYYEAGLFQDITGLDAVSTATGLQYAYANPGTYNVQIITTTNESVIDTLNLTANTKANMHADVQAGRTVITPDKFVTKGVWNGILYISLAPDWTGRYAIGEQVQNGGFTSEGYEILNVLIDGKQYDQFINQNIGHPDNFIYSDQTANTTDKLCRISRTTFLDIMNNESWQESYGLPCLKEQYTFGTHDHTFIMALNASKFKSTSDAYNYWRTDNFVRAQIALSVPTANVATRDIFPYWGTYVYKNKADKKMGIYNPQQLAAYSVEGKIYDKYIGSSKVIDQYVPALLGFPKNSQRVANPYTPSGTEGTYQQFTNGTTYQITKNFWYDDIFVVIAGIEARHNSLNGTTGMGFPLDDPQKSISQTNAIFQNFENGEKITYTLDTQITTVTDTTQKISFTRLFSAKEWREFAEGVQDAFFDIGIYGVGVNLAAGASLTYIKPFIEKLALKLGKKAAAKVVIRFVPLAGWAFAGVTTGLAAYDNAILADACRQDPDTDVNGEGEPPAYYCGRLAANTSAFAIGATLGAAKRSGKINLFGVRTDVALEGKVLLDSRIKTGIQFIRVQNAIQDNPLTRTAALEAINKIDGVIIDQLLDNPTLLSRFFASKSVSTFIVNARDSQRYTHILRGDATGGWHHFRSRRPGSIRNVTRLGRNGVYEADVEFMVDGLTRTDRGNTFFPNEWIEDDVLDAINRAFNGKKYIGPSSNPNNDVYRATIDGIEIEMYIQRTTSKIVSAFPSLNNF